ncbi:sugar kinase [Kiloniella laminariae]|uniref:sugar kinase n=1 Tax=Kiloniella laminariae TaxID=454162 RepID=UPI000379B915|nr:sugar kinase [Kiloniella laminariae]
MTSIGIIGECMVELFRAEASASQDELFKKRFGGDTYNTAYYLAQCSQGAIGVSYITALGDDSLSDEMITTFATAGVQTDLIEKISGAVPGLYMIQTDDHGERSFLYWRSQAPARQLFQTAFTEQLKAGLMTKDWLCFSGITLAILYPEGREELFQLCRDFRSKGGKVAFDSNYRPRLWQDRDEAKYVLNQAYSLCDLALPSYDDEKLLFDQEDTNQSIQRISKLGVDEIILKNGSDSVTSYSDGEVQVFPVEAAKVVKDTTAAGDSFNAGYLWARLSGKSLENSITIAGEIARQVIAQQGAIVPIIAPAL